MGLSMGSPARGLQRAACGRIVPRMSLYVLASIHGYLAAFAVALCLHPWFALRKARRPSRATRLSGYLASAGVVITNVMGWVIYPAYREVVKLDLYRHARPAGVLFEVKEHLAWFAFALAIAGAVMMAAATGPRGVTLRRPIRTIYALVFLLSLVVGVLGVWISSVNGFERALDPLVHGG